MITREEYVQIQLIKSRRSNNAIQPRLVMNPDFPLKGLVKCFCCGEKYTASWQTGRGGKKHPYYRCNNSDCQLYNRNVKRLDLEEKFFAFLTEITPSKKFIRVFKETTLRQWNTEKDINSQQSKSFGKELGQLKIRLENLKEMREGGEIGREEFLERRERLENQITGLQISQNEAKTDELDLEGAIAAVEYILLNIAKIWRDTENIKQKQRLQRLVLPEGIAYDKNTQNFGTAVLSPVFSLYETFQTSPSDFVAGGGFEPPIFWL
ncbi:MAG: recombinase zinc beta ribbon domain-containing protein [Candidatus Yanofskybacteria bacterium]|nr:recombinase zinc beta ribbon domain-containing protein [Candidatus Yanofskybacteria bacterium]